MYYFIVNLNSSSGNGRKIWNRLEPVLKEEKIPYHPFFPKSSESTTRLARRLSTEKAPAVIVVVGGDGTINDVINGLTNFQEITFGYIPTGSGNDFARGLHLEKDPVKALRQILSPSKIIPLSVGSMKTPDFSRRFLVSSGMGFDASVCAGVQTSSYKPFLNRLRMGKLVYTAVALKLVARAVFQKAVLTLNDDEEIEYNGIFFAAAMNLPFEGGGFKFCPEAAAEDDELDLILVEKMPKLKILLMLPTAFFGKHTLFRGVETRKFKKAVLKTEKALDLHTDGELPGKACEVTWEILSEKIRFILR